MLDERHQGRKYLNHMQKLLRALILIMILALVGGVVYTQTGFFGSLRHPVTMAQKALSRAQQKVAEIAAMNKSEPAPVGASVAQPPSAAVPAPAAAPAAASGLGTEAMPVSVKLVPSPDEAGEREKDREILRDIEKDTARLAKTSLIEKYLLIFVGFIYFTTLIILVGLLESVKKSADAAAKAAEAAKKCAETAEAAFKLKAEKHASRKFPPRFYRKR